MASHSKIPVAFPDLEAIAVELGRLREAVNNTPRLSVADVLRRFGRSRSWLYNQLHDGFPRPVRGLWRPADLDDWEAGRTA